MHRKKRELDGKDQSFYKIIKLSTKLGGRRSFPYNLNSPLGCQMRFIYTIKYVTISQEILFATITKLPDPKNIDSFNIWWISHDCIKKFELHIFFVIKYATEWLS